MHKNYILVKNQEKIIKTIILLYEQNSSLKIFICMLMFTFLSSNVEERKVLHAKKFDTADVCH